MNTLLSNQNKTDAATVLALEPWRMLVTPAYDGALNMALDELLLESVIAGGPPVLRFYTWQPATLSLGVNQPLGEVDNDEAAHRGIGLVRRLTGGRAVLHQHELTYAVVARENDPRVSGGVVESYRKISRALVEGLSTLGAAVDLTAPDRRVLYRAAAGTHAEAQAGVDEHSAVCFSAASAYELTSGGKKLVGSAQARRGGALLQHGSILLNIDWDAWVSIFRYASDRGRARAFDRLPDRMASLSQVLGRVVAVEEVISALVPAFESTLSVNLERNDLLPSELDAATALAAGKYASHEWLARH